MKEKINAMLHTQLNAKQKLCLGMMGIFILQIFLMILNVERIGGCGNRDWFNFGMWIFYNKYSFQTIALLALLLGAFAIAYGRLLPGYVILEITTFVLGFANKIVFSKRNQYIRFSDFKLMDEVKGLELDLVSFVDITVIMLFVLGSILGIVTAVLDGKWHSLGNKRMKPAIRWGSVAGFIAVFFIVVQITARADYFQVFHGMITARDMGGIMCLMESSVKIEETTVTDEVVEESYAKYMEEEQSLHKDNEIRPNVITIMSESFWDTDYMKDILTFSEDPLKEYRQLAKSGVSGEIGVNVYGGGTVTTEQEFLTGISNLYMRTAGQIYGELFSRPQESLVSYFAKLGYSTMALHPYTAEYWDRNIGYAGMEFDNFYDMDDFTNREEYRGYISDGALTKEIIDRVSAENEKGKRAFCFAVSVQNHGVILQGIQAKEGDTYRENIHVEYPLGTVNDTLDKSIVEYVNGLQSSVQALKELMEYYKNSEEETVIVFFGDHAPDIALDTCRAYGIADAENVYRTPYLIWSNYNLEKKDYGDSIAPYLSALLIDYAGLPLTNQAAMNLYMQRRYPVHTTFEIEDADGTDIKAALASGKTSKTTQEYLKLTEEEKRVNVVNCWKMRQGSRETRMW